MLLVHLIYPFPNIGCEKGRLTGPVVLSKKTHISCVYSIYLGINNLGVIIKNGYA